MNSSTNQTGGQRWLPSDIAIAVGVCCASLLFYAYTIAPSVLWGDDAVFQRCAAEGVLARDAGGHLLWYALARLFVRLPWSDVAYRVNLLSATTASLTLAAMYGAARSAGIGRSAAVVTCLTLAVSHTFWMHAVRAEVYTVFTLILAIHLWLWASWSSTRAWPIMLAISTCGIALLGHQMAVFLLPGLALLLWSHRAWLRTRDRALVCLLFLVGMLPLAAYVHWQSDGGSVVEGLWTYFTYMGMDFRERMLVLRLPSVPRDVALWIGYLGLQFVGPALLLALLGLVHRKDWQPFWTALLVVYAVNAVFAATYRVNDQFVFYLPGYLVVTLFVARGCERLLRAVPRHTTRALVAVCALSICIPLAVYATLPSIISRADLHFLDVRSLPGRNPHRFFLWPSKRGHTGAREYATEALQALPKDSTLLADHTPYGPLRYLQSVEGLRQDVHVVFIQAGDDLAPRISEALQRGPVYLADNNPAYYNLAGLPDSCLRQAGVVYQVMSQGHYR